MTWNKSKPADNERVRNLGIVIRPNWQAIEEGDSTLKMEASNLNNRTPLVVPNDPTAITDACILYCKDDAAGNAHMFAINEQSKIYQLTGNTYKQEVDNPGSAGGTRYTVTRYIEGDNTRIVEYSGTTVTQGLITFITPFDEIFTAVVSPLTLSLAFSVVKTVNDLNIFTTGPVSFSWFAQGRIG